MHKSCKDAGSAAFEGSELAKRFAGILALVAFVTACVRGLLAGSDFDATVRQACMNLWVFAALGLVFGALAQRAVEESIRSKRDPKREETASSDTGNSTGAQPAAIERPSE